MSKEIKAGPAPAPRRVRATRVGFYRGQRIKEGRTFTLLKPEDFSAKWMEDVDPSTPDELAAMTAPKRRPGESIRTKRIADPATLPKPGAGAAARPADDNEVI